MLAALMLWLPAEAQLHRGGRTIVRGGMFVKPDSLRHKSDSLANNALTRELDSLLTLDFTADSLAVTALRTDDIRTTDSLMRLRLAGIKTEPDSMRHKKGWLMSDSMSLSKVCWISTVLPGYGQIYNKQYWKLPILYGTVGAGLALYINENRTYKPLKREYDAYTDKNLTRTPELDALQAKMIRSNTRRQVYLGLTVASYIYFIGDAAVNYSTNDVSNVKKATTLACIFPGAGPGEKTLLAVGRQHYRKETLRRQQTGSMLQQFTIRERIGVAGHPASRMGRGQRIHEPRRIGNDMVIKQFGRDCCRLSFFGTVSGSSLFTAIRYARRVPAAPQGFRHPGTENPDSAAIHPDRMTPR